MAEIMSTLELIMEKTKHMTMSEDEKAEFKLREVRGKVGGFIQKFLDGIINLEKLKSEIDSLEKDKQDIVTHAVMDESISRIELGDENIAILEVLDVINGIDEFCGFWPCAVWNVYSFFGKKLKNC